MESEQEADRQEDIAESGLAWVRCGRREEAGAEEEEEDQRRKEKEGKSSHLQ